MNQSSIPALDKAVLMEKVSVWEKELSVNIEDGMSSSFFSCFRWNIRWILSLSSSLSHTLFFSFFSWLFSLLKDKTECFLDETSKVHICFEEGSVSSVWLWFYIVLFKPTRSAQLAKKSNFYHSSMDKFGELLRFLVQCLELYSIHSLHCCFFLSFFYF